MTSATLRTHTWPPPAPVPLSPPIKPKCWLDAGLREGFGGGVPPYLQWFWWSMMVCLPRYNAYR